MSLERKVQDLRAFTDLYELVREHGGMAKHAQYAFLWLDEEEQDAFVLWVSNLVKPGFLWKFDRVRFEAHVKRTYDHFKRHVHCNAVDLFRSDFDCMVNQSPAGNSILCDTFYSCSGFSCVASVKK